MIYSADHSRQMNEALYATGGTHQAFIAIEWNQPWDKKADEQFANLYFPLNTPARAKWDALTRQMRVQIIRQPGTQQGLDGKISVFVAYPRELNPIVRAFQIENYADILTLDFEAGEAVESPLYLVCTHSQRDVCCARDGLPVYRALRDSVGDAVWQSSHLGGHRFAATMLCLPSGIYYGRVEPDDAPEIATHTAAGNIINRLYRGRACYTASQQAAEFFLREITRIAALDRFRLVETIPVSDSIDRSIFLDLQTNERHALTIENTLSSWKVIVNSGETEGKSQPVFTLVAHERL